MTSGAWRVASWRSVAGDQRSPPLESMLRLRVRCLVEALFKRVPPLRAFGPPVGMTAKGGLQKRRMGRAARAMGFATEGTEGTEASWVTQRGSVVSVILCGLSCPCVLFILSVVVRLASGGWHGHAKRGHGTTNAPLHRQDMPTRAWACHPARAGQGERGYAIPTPRTGGPITVIPSEAVRSRAKHRGSRDPFFSVAQRHRFCCCGTALDGRRSTFTPIGEYAAALRQAPC